MKVAGQHHPELAAGGTQQKASLPTVEGLFGGSHKCSAQMFLTLARYFIKAEAGHISRQTICYLKCFE